MVKKKKPKAVWTFAPDRRIKPKVPDDLKAEVQAKADELVERVLKPRYIKPPPKKPRWNYPIALWTKWHRSFFYFGSTWASPGPNKIAPTFELRFAGWNTLAMAVSTSLTFDTPTSGGKPRRN